MVLKPNGKSPQTITMTTVRTKTREIVERARYERTAFIVKVYGRPMVAIIDIDLFQTLSATVRGDTSPGENKPG